MSSSERNPPRANPAEKITADTNPATSSQSGQVTQNASAPSRVRNSVFLSYSHTDKDTDWYADVQEYLKQLAVGGDIEFWDDTNIKMGDEWLSTIETKLHEATVAVFLVTPTFLTSEFITREEVPTLLNRQEMEGLVIHALIAKPCDWQQHSIGDFLQSRQLAHSPERTLEEMEGPERRRCLNELVKQIRAEIGIYRHRNRDEHRGQKIIEVESLLGVHVHKEVAGGDTSIIYHASKGQQEIAVKAMVSSPITDTGQSELREEFRKCRTLVNPVFVRMYDLAFTDGYCIATADWLPGHRLTRWLGAVRHDKSTQLRWQTQSVSILSGLAAALAEAHDKGLRYLNIHPDNIRLYNGEPRIYPIDFSTYVASSSHAHGVFAFPIDTLEYLAPEYVSKPAERDDPVENSADPNGDSLRTSALGDQYALGMVALAMLEGRAPVQIKALADVTRLMEFQREPRTYIDDRSTDRNVCDWRREMPGLARIIWRMLEADPDDRWRDMREVSLQLRALELAAFNAPAHGTDAKASYTDYLVGNEAFYARFYTKLFERSAEIEQMFADVDIGGQARLLDAAIERILNFRPNQREPTTLSAVVSSHRHMGLTPEQFEIFGQVFLETLSEEPGISHRILDAWQAIVWPAIEYLKQEST